MPKVVKHWNVFIATNETFCNGEERMLVGFQSSPDPYIEAGFLLFINIDGAQSGVNLREVLFFNIEPVYEEEK